MRRLAPRDPQVAICAGVALWFLGSYLIYSAFEGRGRVRPWPLRILPG